MGEFYRRLNQSWLFFLVPQVWPFWEWWVHKLFGKKTHLNLYHPELVSNSLISRICWAFRWSTKWYNFWNCFKSAVHQIFLMDGKNTFGASRPKMPRSESGWKGGGYDLYSRCFWDSISPWECLIDEIINAFCCAIFVYTAFFVWTNCYTYYLRP